jgi:hypothetical protein
MRKSPDLKEVIEQIPDTAPVIFFCLDNTCFKVATSEGELTNITKCVAEDDAYHINGDLVVAPEIFIKGQTFLLKQLIENCGSHTIYILCPVPRFVTFRCCEDTSHCTNFSDPDYLATLLADLKKVRDIISREIPTHSQGHGHSGALDGAWQEERENEGGGSEDPLGNGSGACTPTTSWPVTYWTITGPSRSHRTRAHPRQRGQGKILHPQRECLSTAAAQTQPRRGEKKPQRGGAGVTEMPGAGRLYHTTNRKTRDSDSRRTDMGTVTGTATRTATLTAITADTEAAAAASAASRITTLPASEVRRPRGREVSADVGAPVAADSFFLSFYFTAEA